MTTTSQHFIERLSQLGNRFEVQRLLGAGGTGWVLEVKDLQCSGQNIAAKILYPHLVENEIALDRFYNEILIARRLTHPNIVRVYGFHSMSELHFITMEYLEAVTLVDWAQSKSVDFLTFKIKHWVLNQVLRALAYSHSQGVTHRDIKPQNVLVLEDNTVRVVDFGISHIAHQHLHLNKANQVVGTPQYMAPEQFLADKLDSRTDIYSFGVLAYWLFTGRPPFTGSSYFLLAEEHINSKPPKLSDDVPELWRAIIQKCLEKKREDRFCSVGEILKLLGDEESTNLDHVRTDNNYLAEVDQEEAPKLPLFHKWWSRPRYQRMIIRTVILIGGFYSAMIYTQFNPYVRRFFLQQTIRFEYSTGIPLIILHPWLQVTLDATSKDGLMDATFGVNMEDMPIENLANIKYLIKAGSDPNIHNPSTGESLLQWLIGLGWFDIATVALNHGASANVTHDGLTILCEALKTSNESIINELIDHGADTNLPCPQGKSPIHTAIDYTQEELLPRLITSSKNLNSQDANGDTPLHYAISRGNMSIAKILLSYNANPNITNNKGLVAADYLGSAAISEKARSELRTLLNLK